METTTWNTNVAFISTVDIVDDTVSTVVREYDKNNNIIREDRYNTTIGQ